MPAGTVAREPDQVDVCVIGSGASGAIIASELAHRGLRILVLETGIAPRTGDSLRSMEPAWETAFVRTGGGRLAQTGRPWSACALGGGTSIFAGITFRFREVDFHASPHTADDALDPTWPFRYADLRKWYDAVERAIGVARAHGMDPIEPEAAPPRLPPHPYSAAGALLAESGLRLGMRPFPTPLAINSIPYGGRPACHRCGPYRTHTIDTARLRYLARRAEQVLREVGATEIAEQESGYQAGSRHLHGTCRAGSDPRNSVVDSWGRVHDTDNVYVVDGGFFPYAGGVNPTFTIQANALRISAEITRRLGAGSDANSAEPAMHPMPTEEGHHV